METGESIKSVGAITLFVQDTRRSKEFYERVFEAPAVYEDDRPWGLRTAAFSDPDGHVWEIASKLPAPVGA